MFKKVTSTTHKSGQFGDGGSYFFTNSKAFVTTPKSICDDYILFLFDCHCRFYLTVKPLLSLSRSLQTPQPAYFQTLENKVYNS